MRSFLLAAMLLCTGLQCANAETDHGAIARAALTEVIRPGYAALTAATGILKDKAAALCAEPSAAALKETKDAFAATVESWSKVEIFRFGPVNKDHRYERLFYWPDPKGIGLRQVKAALAKKDETVTLADTLVGKSVALQGLPALEYLLYGDGAETLTSGDPEVGFRCSFASSVATALGERLDAERLGGVAIEQILERGQALQRDALGAEGLRVGHGLVLLGKRVADLLQAESLGIGPIEQALKAVVLDHGTEAIDLDLAPGRDCPREGVPGLFEVHHGRLRAERLDFGAEGGSGLGERGIARADDLAKRRARDGGVIRFGMCGKRTES